jgi:hypothetical protein
VAETAIKNPAGKWNQNYGIVSFFHQARKYLKANNEE